MQEGWIKLHKKLRDHEMWLAEPFTMAQAWVDLLLLANTAPGEIFVRGKWIRVERGQVAWSEVRLSERWQWSRNRVRRFFDSLRKRKMAIQQKDNRTSIVTILNFEEYQDTQAPDDTADDTAGDTAPVQHLYTKKKERKKERRIPPKPPTGGTQKETLAGFDDFWAQYPRKTAKGAARKSWAKLTMDERREAYKAIRKQVACHHFRNRGEDFIPHPSTWINQQRWEDELRNTAEQSACYDNAQADAVAVKLARKSLQEAGE